MTNVFVTITKSTTIAALASSFNPVYHSGSGGLYTCGRELADHVLDQGYRLEVTELYELITAVWETNLIQISKGMSKDPLPPMHVGIGEIAGSFTVATSQRINSYEIQMKTYKESDLGPLYSEPRM